ncbi:hypothetical protein BGZ65_009712 [Modicella reniformis]|uniref:Protein kinase domain-containing protein n=1 Tax=Modicella reniformis TaxID=1440133 RepID=A0A9P6IHV7_9FUNG|nr:hypothetical protein BGZ65_009712 [Modicella reniformis]
MGIIHVADWKGTKVAIKEASAQIISKEVEIYNRMKGNDGVIPFYGVTYPPGLEKLCIVTKYAEGGSLSWYFKTTFNKLTWADKLTLATQISSSVARLHQEGIYHRDLHGGNILIDETGKALLADFGESTVMEELMVRSMDEFAIATRATPEGKSTFVSEIMSPMTAGGGVGVGGESVDGELTSSSSSAPPPSAPPPPPSSLLPVDNKHGENNHPGGTIAATENNNSSRGRTSDSEEKHDPLFGLTSGHSAFSKLPQDVHLVVSILNGKREELVEGTPQTYRELYERCWDSDPEMRPSLDEIMSTLAKVRASLTPEQLAETRERNNYHEG